MLRQFSKPQGARQIEARARARAMAVKVTVVVVAREYTSRSQSTGETYTIRRTPAGWACTCRGYYETGCCKHLGQVARRSEREGWAFGRIAPLSKVARHFPLTDPAPLPVVDFAAQKRAALADLYGD